MFSVMVEPLTVMTGTVVTGTFMGIADVPITMVASEVAREIGVPETVIAGGTWNKGLGTNCEMP